jgi:hypothetical protein
MNKIISFIRHRWFRVTLSSMLIVWTIATLTWLVTSPGTPWWVVGHASYDLIVEGTLAISLWSDVILKRGRA